jgi:hypothetical protein
LASGAAAVAIAFAPVAAADPGPVQPATNATTPAVVEAAGFHGGGFHGGGWHGGYDRGHGGGWHGWFPWGWR